MSACRLILSGLCAVGGFSAFVAFLMLRNYPSAFLSCLVGIIESVITFLHVLYIKRKIHEWYSPRELRQISRFGITILVIDMGLLTYFTTVEVFTKKPIMPIPTSLVLPIIWCIIIIRSAAFLIYYSRKYQHISEYEPVSGSNIEDGSINNQSTEIEQDHLTGTLPKIDEESSAPSETQSERVDPKILKIEKNKSEKKSTLETAQDQKKENLSSHSSVNKDEELIDFSKNIEEAPLKNQKPSGITNESNQRQSLEKNVNSSENQPDHLSYESGETRMGSASKPNVVTKDDVEENGELKYSENPTNTEETVPDNDERTVITIESQSPKQSKELLFENQLRLNEEGQTDNFINTEKVLSEIHSCTQGDTEEAEENQELSSKEANTEETIPDHNEPTVITNKSQAPEKPEELLMKNQVLLNDQGLSDNFISTERMLSEVHP